MTQSRNIRCASLGGRLRTLVTLSLAATGLTAFAGGAEAGEWRVLTVNGKPAEGDATLTFNADGSFGGSTGCNRFTAAGQFASGWLVVDGPVATTQRACAGEAITRQELRILSIFEDGLAITYDPFAETLKLTGRTATIVLVPLATEPAPEGPAAAPENPDPAGPAAEVLPEAGSAATPEPPEDAPTIFNTAYVAVHGLSGRLNVRAEASTGAKIVGGVRPGALLSNKGCEDRTDRTWCHVAHIGNGRPQGWVAAEYLKPAPAALRAAESLFDGIGTLPCTDAGSDMATTCDYGVAHDPDGTAAVTVFHTDGTESLVVFRNGVLAEVDEAEAGAEPLPSADRADDHMVIAVGEARFEIPMAVIAP